MVAKLIQFRARQDGKVRISFLISLAVLLTLIFGTGTGWHKFMAWHRQRQLIQWGDTCMAQGQYEDAAEHYRLAVSHHPEDAALAIKLGDALYAWSATKPRVLRSAALAWEIAARAKTDDLTTLRRLLAFYAEMAEVRPTTGIFRDMGDIAERITAINALDSQARTFQRVATAGNWMCSPIDGEASDTSAHDKEVAGLSELLDRNAADSDALFYLSLAASRRFRELKGSEPDKADAVLTLAEQRLDNAVQLPKPNAVLLYRAAQGFTFLAQARDKRSAIPGSGEESLMSGRRAQTRPTEGVPAILSSGDSLAGTGDGPAPSTQPDALVGQYLSAARSAIDRARALEVADTPHRVQIHILQAQLAAALHDRIAAEKLFHDVQVQFPASLNARFAAANFLAATDPAQAIKLLELPDPSDSAPGPRALAHSALQGQILALKAGLYVNDVTETEDPAIRYARIQKAQAACDELSQQIGDSTYSLALRARLQLLQGRPLEAIQLVDRALPALRSVKGADDSELNFIKASAFSLLHEPDNAVLILRTSLKSNPDYIAGRLLLSSILLSQKQFSQAAAEADLLEKRLPQDLRVVTLKLSILAAQNAASADPERATLIRTYYGKLPEANTEQQVQKARQAIILGDRKDAIRLLDAARAANPSSAALAALLAQTLADDQQTVKGNAVMSEALREHPNNAGLLYNQKEMAGASATELKQFAEKVVDKNADAFDQALREAAGALDRRDLVLAKRDLDAAGSSKPEDPVLLALQFRLFLIEGRWDPAQECVDKLAKLNADQMDGLSFKFQLALAKGDHASAAAVAQAMTYRHEDYWGSWNALGEALQAGSHFQAAIEAYEHVLLLQPANVGAMTGKAKCLIFMGQQAAAGECIQKGLALAPADSDLRELDLRQQLNAGDPHRLIATREQAVQQEPGRWDDVIALARVYLRIADFESAANPTDAADALRHARELLAGAIARWPDEQTCYRWAADVAMRAGDVAGGEMVLQQLAGRPLWAYRPEPWNALGEYELIGGNLAGAQRALHEALNRGAGLGTALQLSRVLLKQGAAKDALATLVPYASEPAALRLRIEILLAQGLSGQAEAEVKDALNLNSTSTHLMMLLGMVYASRNDMVQSLFWLDRAVASDGNGPARKVRGAMRFQQPGGPIDKVIEDLQIAHDTDPADGETAAMLAQAYSRKHDDGSAVQVLRQCLLLAPQETHVRMQLISLKMNEVSPNWDEIAHLIAEGRSWAAADPNWNVFEARMWFARGNAAKGAEIMREAIRLASLDASRAAAQSSTSAPDNKTPRVPIDLIREDLAMLLKSGDGPATTAEADRLLTQFGPSGLSAAWCHLARATIQLRAASSDLSSGEFDAALAAAEESGDLRASVEVLGEITAQVGIEDALRRIALHGSAGTHAIDRVPTATLSSDPRGPVVSSQVWDVVKVDLLSRKGDLIGAAEAADALLADVDNLPHDYQILFLRTAADVYSRIQPVPETAKAYNAFIKLLDRAPNDRWALNNLATLLLEQVNPPRPKEAVSYSLRAYEQMERYGEFDPLIVDTHGWALASAGQTVEGIRLLGQAVEKSTLPDIEYHLGEALLMAGRAKDAYSHLLNAVSIINHEVQNGKLQDAALSSRVGDALNRAFTNSAF